MSKHHVIYCRDLAALGKALSTLENEGGDGAALLFAAEGHLQESAALEAVLVSCGLDVAGGFFPKIIADGQLREEGFLLQFLPNGFLASGLIALGEKGQEDKMRAALSGLCQEGAVGCKSALCFVDAFAPNKGELVQGLYDELGPSVNYLGAGAGSLSFQPLPCIIYGKQVHVNAAFIALSEVPVSLGVAHGWEAISEPMKVTATDGNTVLSLNWKPAFEVYESEIMAHGGLAIREANFFSIAKSYPLGLVRLDAEMVVRDPYAAAGMGIHVVDEVPEGDYVSIMNGNLGSLLAGTRQALEQAGQGENRFCVDCISRVLFMGADFDQELAVLNEYGPINGVLSIGEIANAGHAALEIFNKTVVVAQWTPST